MTYQGPDEDRDALEALGRAVRFARQQSSLTQRELEALTGVDQTAISRMERGVVQSIIEMIDDQWCLPCDRSRAPAHAKLASHLAQRGWQSLYQIERRHADRTDLSRGDIPGQAVHMST